MTDDTIIRYRSSVFSLGRLYRIITDVTGYSPTDFNNACSWPLKHVTLANQKLHYIDKYSKDDNFIERMSRVLLGQIEEGYAEYEARNSTSIPVELQGTFQLGFYRGVHDISMGARIMYLRRRGENGSKERFANIIGVSAERLAALEEDETTPTDEEIAKLAAHFNLDPIDITDCTSKYKDVVFRPKNLI